MSESKTFYLPDLGEGLPDATVVEWAIKVGDIIKLDEPLVSMETAKAVVDVPSPFSGKVTKLYGENGDVIITGHALVDIALDASLPQRADAEETGHSHGAPPPAKATPAEPEKPAPKAEAKGEASADAGTVVGAMQSSDRVHVEAVSSAGGAKAMPAVRAMAKKLGVDLWRITATGADGTVTMKDVKDAAANPPAPLPSPAGRGAGGEGPSPAQSSNQPEPSSALRAPSPEGRREDQRSTLSAAGKPMRTSPHGDATMGQPEQLKGVRRNMARVMADAHARVVPTMLCDDADIHAWRAGNDITIRLIRSVVKACKAVPALNAWFDGDSLTRTLHPHVDIGIAVDTDDGLFVPALRNADVLDAVALRAAINRLRDQVMNRSIPASELSGYTISLSNFGVFAGRYATPIVVPPTVAIIAAGKGRHQMTPIMGGFESHKVIPLSLTFDHRAATGGEAARFLKAMLDDLTLAD